MRGIAAISGLPEKHKYGFSRMKCKVCKKEAAVALKSHNAAFCETCYLDFFHRQVEKGIKSQKLFNRDEKILVALSGGKDSLALMLALRELGYQADGLFIDLDIPGSSAAARAHVEAFCRKHGLNLRIVELEREGLAIPHVKARLRRPICSACGQIKRYYFNKAALEGSYAALATGHNLDDEAARLFSNTLRWDGDYLGAQGPRLEAGAGFARKVKPLWRLTEFETANYAFLRGIEHHWAPCPYGEGASFSVLKGILNSLEGAMPGRKMDFYQGFLARGRRAFAGCETSAQLTNCAKCGMPTSAGEFCGICRLKGLLAENGQ